MMCIICLGKNPISDGNPYTDEHIFPEAIGGTLILEEAVCKKCNDYMGRFIDHYLTNHPLVLIERHKYKLKSKGGKIPSPLPGFVDNYGRIATFDLEKTNISIYPKRTKDKNKNNINYIAGNDTKEETIKNLNKLLKRHGHSPLTEEKIAELFNQTLSNSEKITLNASIRIDFIEYKRSILKIAYELAVYYLGKKYLYDPMAIKIRECLSYYSKEQPISKNHWSNKFLIESVIEFYNSSIYKSIFSIHENRSHIGILVKAANTIICYVKIFNTFLGIVCITKNANNYSDFYSNSIIIKV